METKQPYKLVHHEFTRYILKTMPYCANCGLLILNNRFTAWAMRMGCNNRDHPDYEKMRKGG